MAVSNALEQAGIKVESAAPTGIGRNSGIDSPGLFMGSLNENIKSLIGWVVHQELKGHEVSESALDGLIADITCEAASPEYRATHPPRPKTLMEIFAEEVGILKAGNRRAFPPQHPAAGRYCGLCDSPISRYPSYCGNEDCEFGLYSPDWDPSPESQNGD